MGWKLVALALAFVFAGCTSEYLISQRTADALAGVAPADRQHVAVPAVDNYQHPYLLIADGLRVPGYPDHPKDRVWVSVPDLPRSPGLRKRGAIVAVLGLVISIVGAAVVGSGPGCDTTGALLCGLGKGIAGYTLLGVGLTVGTVGAMLAIVGATGHPAEVQPGQPGIVYLPQ